MRLRAPRDERAEQVQMPVADLRFRHRYAALQVPLAPRPPADERSVAVEPGERRHSIRAVVPRRQRRGAEHGAVVEGYRELRRNPRGDEPRVVHRDLQNRPGHVVILPAQRFSVLHEMVLERESEFVPECRRAADRDDRAAVLEELDQRRRRRIRGDPAEPVPVFLGNRLRLRPAEAPELEPRTDGALREDDDVVVLAQASRVEPMREDEFEVRVLELLEDPADPAGRHGAAVRVPERDARGPQAQGVGVRVGVQTPEVDAQFGGQRRDRVVRPSPALDVEGACGMHPSALAQRRREPVDLVPRGVQPVDRRERVVRLMAEQEAVRPARVRDRPRHGARVPLRDLLERPVEALQDAVELDPHLDRQRPARVVVRRGRRRPRIEKIVRVVLRLEHVEDVRPEGLRGPHHVRA